MDHRDDGHPVYDRPAHLERRPADDVDGLAAGGGVRQPADAILDDDHRTVDDQAEIDRPQAHQAARDAPVEHQVAGEEHREGDRRRDDQPGPQVAKQDQEHGDDQHASLDEIAGHGADRLLNQGASVVVGVDDHPFGQGLLDLADLVLDPVDHDPAVLARQQV